MTSRQVQPADVERIRHEESNQRITIGANSNLLTFLDYNHCSIAIALHDLG